MSDSAAKMSGPRFGFWRDAYGGTHFFAGCLSVKSYRTTLRPKGRGLSIFWRTNG